DHLVGVDAVHHGAGGHGDDHVLAALAVHLPAPAVLAALGAEQLLVAEVDQGVEVLVGDQPDATAIAAVAAIRPAQRNELLAAEAHPAVAAVAGGDGDLSFVDQLHGCLIRDRGIRIDAAVYRHAAMAGRWSLALQLEPARGRGDTRRRPNKKPRTRRGLSLARGARLRPATPRSGCGASSAP